MPAALKASINSRVLQFVVPRSAHGDIVEPLWRAVRRLPDVAWYCADPAAFRSVLLHVDGIVFAFAEGMSGVTVRLPREAGERQTARGAGDRSELGEGWVFLPFENDGPFFRELSTLVRLAYDNVKSGESDIAMR